ncbi:MAG: hydroxymethylglutaryl-CoA reductase [Oligoflexus sp.]
MFREEECFGLETIPGKNEHSEKSKFERIEYIQNNTGQSLTEINRTSLSANDMHGYVENFIGAVQVPVGLAGPLLFHGKDVQGLVSAPFATSEGALVASACRGSRLLSTAGGVSTLVLAETVHRAPCFNCRSLREAMDLKDFIDKQVPMLKTLVRNASRYAELQEVHCVANGRSLHVIMHFSTGDAAGQNMVTIVADHLAKWIAKEAHEKGDILIRSYQVEGGMNGDKKVNFYSFLKGRGVRVAAECFIPDHIFRQQMRLEPEVFFEHYQRGLAATVLAGGVGVNVNVANVIAAIFLATGQDVASVHESSVGYLHIEKEKDGLYCCLTLPSLLIGTVGGGTSLPTQKEALQLLSCEGAGKKHRLAEIIAGFCLALDISTWSAIAAHGFTQAHKTLGRR